MALIESVEHLGQLQPTAVQHSDQGEVAIVVGSGVPSEVANAITASRFPGKTVTMYRVDEHPEFLHVNARVPGGHMRVSVFFIPPTSEYMLRDHQLFLSLTWLGGAVLVHQYCDTDAVTAMNTLAAA